MDEHRVAACILFTGFLTGFYSGAGVNSAQDLLQNSFVPTSSLLSVIGGVFAVCNIVSTWCGIRRGSESLKILVCSLMVFVGTLASALLFNIYAKLICLVFASVGLAVLDIQFVALASLHQETGVSSYSAGMGVGVFVGSVFYTGLTTGLCVKFTHVYMISSCFSFFFILICFLLNPEESQTILSQGYTLIRTSVGLPSSASESVLSDEKSDENYESDGESVIKSEEGKVNISQTTLSWSLKYEILKETFFPILLPFAVSTLSEYTSYQSISTTLAFDNSPFQPRDHYQFYTLMFFFGLLLFRSYPFIVMAFCSSWADKIRIRRIWLISVLQVICTLFLLFSSLYRFLPSVGWVLIVIFCHGCLGGLAYVECLLMASKSKQPDFAGALVESGYQVVILIAAILGLSLEHALVDHCLEFYSSQYEMQELCFTRSGVNTTSICQ